MSVQRSNSAQTLLVRLNSLDSTTLAPSVYAVLSKSCPNLLYFAVLAPPILFNSENEPLPPFNPHVRYGSSFKTGNDLSSGT
jgi:hypothetical protein